MATLPDELSQIISAFDENEIEYAVCGGLALTIHGFPRATFDIDILIREESLEQVFEVVAKYGYDIHGLDISFKERAVEIRRVSKVDEVWDSKEKVEWQDKNLWIVSREGLIKMKELAGRDKDLIDIGRLKDEENRYVQRGYHKTFAADRPTA